MFGRRKDPAPSAPKRADGAKLMAQVCIWALLQRFSRFAVVPANLAHVRIGEFILCGIA